ncbi:MAG: hypothetical protein KME20_06510 [Kaiparowitsia implicata GSE-PSE-MK54-09C]|jgi:hypothetical protein|nr:hypothetical protein [Kaiparowitsia implicata GSE-PSE-MK54-09C]
MFKNKILLLFVVIVCATSVFLVFVNYRERSLGDASWVLEDMWGKAYLSASGGRLENYDEIYLQSLNSGVEDRQVLDFIWKNKCKDGGDRCFVIMASAANLLIDSQEIDSGLTALVEARNKRGSKDFCPIVYELSILRYKLREVEGVGSNVDGLALSLLRKIRSDGGVVEDLRMDSCIKFSTEKPEFFRAYALMVARMMSRGGDITEEAANKINFAIGIQGEVYE